MIKQQPIKFNSKEEWLKGRMNSIGSSEVAAILNLSKWMSPLDVYNKIVNKELRVIKPNERMIIGTKSEPLIRKQFALDNKNIYKIINPPKHNWVFTCPKNNRISCSPDGFIYSKLNKKYYGLEIKHVELIKKDDIEQWESNTLVNYYYTQILQYLIVIPELDGICLLAHLVYKKFDEKTKTFINTKSIDKQFWIYREDVIKNLDYIFNKEIDFLTKCDNGIKPKTVIVF